MLEFENTKCECGHQNPVGTVLCESCGKPLDEEADSDAPLEMRYDGIARQSQKSNPDLIDRIWSFFSSVKVAVRLIVITLLGAMIGTIFTQENAFISFDPTTYYEERYGWIGRWYYKLGLSHTYTSWWFITLLVMIGTSLVICSLDRVLPLYRALNKQQIRKHEQFLTRQKTVYNSAIGEQGEKLVSGLAEQLKRKRYKVHTDGTALLAEKNRFSRWGPYINHIGLIVFLLAVLLRFLVPGWAMDSYVTIPEGETVQIPKTDYYIKNEKFTLQYYTDAELPKELQGTARAKLYETKAVLYKCTANCDDPAAGPKLEEVKRHNIIVNDPLSYKGLKAYQFGFDDTPTLKAVKPSLVDKKTGEVYGTFDLEMRNPQLSYKLGPYTLELKQSYMDFALDANGLPTTKSREPNAPAFVFVIKGPDLPANGQPYMYFPRDIDKQQFSQDKINGEISQRFDIKVQSMDDVTFAGIVSSLNIRTDRVMPFIWFGAGISIFGLLLGAYWHHRRIWLRVDNGRLTLGAHTNKNNYGMRAEVASVLNGVGIVVEPKSLDNGGDKS